MIVALAQDSLRAAARIAVREQMWTDARGVRGLPTRRAGSDFTGLCTDLTWILDLIDGADALVWSGPELTVGSSHDVTWHIRLPRPGHDGSGDDRLEIVSDWDLDAILRSAQDSDTASVVTCLSTGCGLIGHPLPGRDQVQVLAGIHDQVRHRGSASAQVGTLTQMCWEVEGPDGQAIYRGAPAGSHLLPVMAVAGRSR